MSKFSNAIFPAEGERSEEQLIEEAEQFHRERTAARLNRRKLITNLSMAAGAAGMLGVAGCSNNGPATVVTAPTPTPTSTTPSVEDVLNFALNLEYLEASFYSYIVSGTGLPASLMGSSPGTVTGGAKVTFTNPFVANIAANLMTEEVQHVQLLSTTINSVFGANAAVSMPNLSLAPSAALTVSNDATFLAVARQLEGVGVSAYAGGAQYLVSNVTALNYAAQILDVEAQHSGALRQACIQLNVMSPAADSMDMPPTSTQLFNTSNTTGLNPYRTVSQVLQIVYAAAGQTGVSSGGFYPNGMNGNLKTS